MTGFHTCFPQCVKTLREARIPLVQWSPKERSDSLTFDPIASVGCSVGHERSPAMAWIVNRLDPKEVSHARGIEFGGCVDMMRSF